MTDEPQPLPIGRVFPARDPVSQFITSLAIAINDLAVMDRHMHEAMDEGSSESVFYLRLVCSYLHELGLRFGQARRVKPVQGFVASLPDDAREDFAFISRLGQGELSPIRQVAFHFPKIGDKRLTQALEAVKAVPARIRHEQRGRRMEYADHVAAYMSFGPLSDADAAKLMGRISEAIDRLADFGRTAIDAHAERVGVIQKGP
jgi:hypothetical protein